MEILDKKFCQVFTYEEPCPECFSVTVIIGPEDGKDTYTALKLETQEGVVKGIINIEMNGTMERESLLDCLRFAISSLEKSM